MRRAEKALPPEEAVLILEQGEYGILSLVTPEGEAYGVPLNYVFMNDTVYFHAALEGKKLGCIAAHSQVSFCVVGDSNLIPQRFSTAYRSVVLSGTAERVEGDEKIAALTGLVAKYSPGYIEPGKAYIAKDAGKTAVVGIRCLRISGKGNRD
jgi:nitroimidazol reductase NimA-like FMN-containing flavoprotein (pyridoxamine 5'-phosphate oxidase superfamily)